MLGHSAPCRAHRLSRRCGYQADGGFGALGPLADWERGGSPVLSARGGHVRRRPAEYEPAADITLDRGVARLGPAGGGAGTASVGGEAAATSANLTDPALKVGVSLAGTDDPRFRRWPTPATVSAGGGAVTVVARSPPASSEIPRAACRPRRSCRGCRTSSWPSTSSGRRPLSTSPCTSHTEDLSLLTGPRPAQADRCGPDYGLRRHRRSHSGRRVTVKQRLATTSLRWHEASSRR